MTRKENSQSEHVINIKLTYLPASPFGHEVYPGNKARLKVECFSQLVSQAEWKPPKQGGTKSAIVRDEPYFNLWALN